MHHPQHSWNNIPSADMSPRIQNGVLMWYENDTFTVDLTMDLVDQDGEKIEIPDNATVTVRFVDEFENVVKEFVFEEISANTVTLTFDATTSALFGKGNYTYDLYYSADNRTTMVSRNEVVVE